jgi:Fe-S-cluster containining protein
MKKNKRISKLLKLDCGQCNSCCRDIQVDVTDADVKRLVKHTGISADRLVRLYGHNKDENDIEGDWIKLSYGKRAIVLNKKRNGDCMFLGKENGCIAYKARPMTCRIFPVCVVYDEEHEIVNLEKSEVITDKTISCKCSPGRGQTYKNIMSTAKRARVEHAAFIRKVDQWNDLDKKGNRYDFLRFLGFNISTNGSR